MRILRIVSCAAAAMANGRLLLVLGILALSCCSVRATVYTRCQLTRELLKLQLVQTYAFSRTFLSNWVCLIEQESDRNTSALIVKSPRRKYYGLFQIGSEYCKEGRKGGKCDIACESLLDDNIKDDAVCAETVFTQEGFKYWKKWEIRCKGHTLPDIEKCPDWQNPPSRTSPIRDRRTLSSKSNLRFSFVPYHRANAHLRVFKKK